ncbi:hypothetical protein EQG49_13535 [Periweissella cryptocerci]|uniref:Aminopyrimidine aminohydrolase n=1 Tax=Periweissella cryptocerci TaxID=2506420 RepID=A0A4P6YX36_9LACO|nr:hypothetical protein [Periweissella cryptocerci]QBO37420.1 hypothetical protein EQG49_13535 [Periweissella cryptocerci]
MKFSDSLIEAANPIIDAILAHPFLQDVVAGTISPARLIAYVQQDEHYLSEYDKGFAQAFTMTDNIAEQAIFAPLVAVTTGESVAHNWLLSAAGTSLDELDLGKANPTTTAYLNHLALAGQHDYLTLVAALIPCAWTYRVFGETLAPQVGEETALQKWLHVYAGDYPEILTTELADELFSILDFHAASLTTAQRQTIQTVFLQSCEYEWRFWDAVYHQETWTFENTIYQQAEAI